MRNPFGSRVQSLEHRPKSLSLQGDRLASEQSGLDRVSFSNPGLFFKRSSRSGNVSAILKEVIHVMKVRSRPIPTDIKFKWAAFLLLFFYFYGCGAEAKTLLDAAADPLREHVRYLASERLAGRGVDGDGIRLARDYIAREFNRYGLKSAGDNGTYFQTFDVATGVVATQPTSLALGDDSLPLQESWTPLGLSASGTIEADVVFAGYGITARAYGYDDYAGIDVEGKIVLVLRYEPPPKDAKSPFQKSPSHSHHATLRAKANNARDHGAVGMILVNLDTPANREEELISMTGSLWRGGNSLIAAQVKRSAVEKWLDGRGISLARLKEQIDREGKPASGSLSGAKARLEVSLQEIRRPTDNVVGILRGSDPKLKDEAIVVGAHYDHLGLGRFGTPDSKTAGQIHYGADDNASGTAVVLRMAEQLSRTYPRPARTIVFIAFSAEELGLHGSRHYVNHPAVPLSATRAMLNFDMVGRLRDNQLTVFAARSAHGLSEIINQEAALLRLIIRESDNVGRSDHALFYNKKIPSVHFFTGIHPDYHRPTDTWDKLNIDGMARITELALATVEKIANLKEPMTFASLPSRPLIDPGDRTEGPRTYLGSIPDFAASEDGVKLAGVSNGSPAALAGLREGDIIVQFAGAKIHNLEDLAEQLRNTKPGDEVEIVVRRGNELLALRTVLGSRGNPTGLKL